MMSGVDRGNGNTVPRCEYEIGVIVESRTKVGVLLIGKRIL